MTEQEEFEFRRRYEQEQAAAQAAPEAPAAPAQPQRSFGQRVARQAGLTLRAGVEGALALPAMVADAPMQVARAAGVHTPKTSQEAISALLTRAGVPEAETGLEQAVQFGAQALVPTNLGAKAGAAVGSKVGKGTARSLMNSALKPTIEQHRSGDAAVAVDTMLREGVNATPGGVAKMRAMVDDLNRKVSDTILNSTKAVDKKFVMDAVDDLMTKFRKQVAPQGDLAAIRNTLDDFLNHPDIQGRIPVQLAQELKQGTYRILSKKYGQLGSAETEAQKAIARGLKEGVAAAEPIVAGLNAKESKLIRALDVAERRMLMDLNKNPGGLAWLAGTPQGFAAFMADKSALFKSLVARMMNASGGPVGATAGAAGGMSLYGLSQSAKPQNPPPAPSRPPQSIPLSRVKTLTPDAGLRVPEAE
jgi:hypothetical protein